MERIRRNGKFAKKSQIVKKKESAEALRKYNNSKRQRSEESIDKNSEKSEIQCAVEGSRIIDIPYINEQTSCNLCGEGLCLQNIQHEVKRGFASIFHIECVKCKTAKKIYTSRKSASDSGNALFNVNCKAALGCIDVGIGHEQLKKLAVHMDVPPPSHHTLKLAEKRMGNAFVAIADESCKKAIQLEKEHTLTALESEEIQQRPYIPPNSKRDIIYLSVSYDFGWDKRGYDSKSGRGSVIGMRSGKILAADSYSTSCAMCLRGHNPADHTCGKNWQNSAKAMEAAMGVKLMLENRNFVNAGVAIGTFIGDEDASTYAALQRQSPHKILKLSDPNHVRKKFTSGLYKLSARFRELNRGTTILYLKKCFNSALDQNKNNIPATTEALRNIANHVFDIHDNCGQWCRAKKDPHYRFKSLPGGKALANSSLKTALEELLQNFIRKLGYIATEGSSQANESFNSMVISKAPKSKHYSASSAYKYRTASAVCQKNLGVLYIKEIYDILGLPMSSNVQIYLMQDEERRTKKATKQDTESFKRQRYAQKEKRTSILCRKERQEGISYLSGMNSDIDIEMPEDLIPENNNNVESINNGQISIVTVDIETTSLLATCDIIQIAATFGDKHFSRYMFPGRPIDPRAAQATGFSVQNGHLYQHGNVVTTTPARLAAHDFLDFLKSCGERCILIGHNIVRFDMPRIIRWLRQQDLFENFQTCVHAVTDSMPLLANGKIKSLGKLSEKFLNGEEWERLKANAHDALIDCQLLDGLIAHFQISHDTVKQQSKSLTSVVKRLAVLQRRKVIAKTLLDLQSSVSKLTINRLADEGLSMEKLQEIFNKHGAEGIKIRLSTSIIKNGKQSPCVTSTPRILNSIVNYLTDERNKLAA